MNNPHPGAAEPAGRPPGTGQSGADDATGADPSSVGRPGVGAADGSASGNGQHTGPAAAPADHVVAAAPAAGGANHLRNGRPRLDPKPLWRPPVDPLQAGAFGRPGGVNGSFGARRTATPVMLGAPPVPEFLEDAFGRPGGGGDSLGRPPAVDAPDEQAEPPGDPWRDPNAGARLGPPALPAAVPDVAEPVPAERFTLRQALFERRLRPSAVIGVLVAALVIGAMGAAIGVFAANRLPAAVLDPAFQLATVAPAVTREPGSVADIAARVLPSVVSLEVRTGDVGETGSGVVIDGSGYILTNNHVISTAATDPSAELTVVFNDGSRVPGIIVGRDPLTDLAVLKVDVSNATVAQLGDSAALAVGDPVIAIGSPLGLAGTVTTGIVSAKDRPVRLQGGGSDTDAVIDAVQTDAAVNPGNSGGPLVDASGAVVGINTAIRTLGGDSSGSIGLGFAIPIAMAKNVAEQIIRSGTVQHSTMGVNARSATDGVTDGAQVQNVQAGGAAALAGIAEGDVITKVGDRSVGNADELVVAVRENPVGASVPVVLMRDGRQMTVTVTLTAE
jgi:putative serine protease PepD